MNIKNTDASPSFCHFVKICTTILFDASRQKIVILQQKTASPGSVFRFTAAMRFPNITFFPYLLNITFSLLNIFVSTKTAHTV